MNLFTIVILITLSCIICTTAAGDKEPVITLVYVGEISDNSYLAQAMLGITRGQEDFHFNIRKIQWDKSSPVDPVKDEDGTCSCMVLIMGDIMNGDEYTYSREYSGIPFVIIDGLDLSGPAVSSVSFSMYGTSYLAGVLAANQTKTGKIGIIAGVDAPVLRGFTDGFVDGAYAENPEAKVNISYLAEDYTGFFMPERAGDITRDMHRNGTDVIYQIAGGSGLGVIETAHDLSDLLVIGSDSDQSVLAPDTVMASAIKRVDLVLYEKIQSVFSDTYKPGSEIIGLKDNATSLLLNPRFNSHASLIRSRMMEAVEKENRYSGAYTIIPST